MYYLSNVKDVNVHYVCTVVVEFLVLVPHFTLQTLMRLQHWNGEASREFQWHNNARDSNMFQDCNHVNDCSVQCNLNSISKTTAMCACVNFCVSEEHTFPCFQDKTV